MLAPKPHQVTHWVDTQLGTKGYEAWIIVIAWPGLFYYGIFLPVNDLINHFVGADDQSFLNISIIVLIITILLLAGALSFILQAVKTAQRIDIINESQCTVRFYYGRKLIFDLREVSDVSPFKVIGFRKFMTPFYSKVINKKISSKSDSLYYMNSVTEEVVNYKVTLKGNATFYISGLIPNIDALIKLLSTYKVE